jgi:hypothetical protein
MTQHLGLLNSSCRFPTIDNHNTTVYENTRQVSELAYIYIFIDGSKVCGRYAADARLIRASVNAPTSMVGFSFQTSQACDHLDLWATFLPGEQGLHFDTKP